MIPETVQQDIKARADIVEVVGQFLTLKKAGTRYQGLCPFHHERTPSFYLTPGKQIFKCFGCGKGGDVFAFLQEHENLTYPDALKWVAAFYKIPVDGAAPTYTAPPRRAAPVVPAPTLPPSFVDPAVFEATLTSYEKNNLVQWLCRKLGHTLVMGAVKAYHVGTAKKGGTIFWQVNHDGKAGTGKIMFYPPQDHRRDKSKNPTWIHARAKQTDPLKYHWVKYWFGEHLLATCPTRTVAIVESEKTALVCSLYLSKLGCVWLANGGKDLARDKWPVLKGRKVILYPDLGPIEEGETPFQAWTAQAAQMRDFGIDASVNDFLETRADGFERGQKWDLADFLLMRDLSEFLAPTPTAHHPEPHPAPPAAHTPPANLPAPPVDVATRDFVPDLVGRYGFRFDRAAPITAAPPTVPATDRANEVEALANRLSACALPTGAVCLAPWQTIHDAPKFVDGHLELLRSPVLWQLKQPYFERLSAFLGILEQMPDQCAARF